MIKNILERKKNITKKIVFFVPVFLISSIVIYKIIYGPIHADYREFMSEDGLVEYSTSITYFLATIFSFLIFKSIKTNYIKYAILFLVLGFCFLFVGLEEISWGQRILGIETPDLFSENVQSETNVHNLESINSKWPIAFIVLGIAGGFSWWMFPIRSNFSYNLFVKFFVPRWFLMAYFIPIFVFWFLRKITPDAYHSLKTSTWLNFFHLRDQEFFELLIAMGFLLFILTSFSVRKQDFSTVKMCEQFQEKTNLVGFLRDLNKPKKIILVIIIGLIIFGISFQIYNTFTEQIKQNFHFFTIVNTNQEDVFQIISNIENYPNIFPENVKSVKILEQTQNTIKSKMKIKSGKITFVTEPSIDIESDVSYVKSASLYENSGPRIFTTSNLEIDVNVKFEIVSPDSFKIEILDGEAVGSKILMNFKEVDQGTEIETRIQIQSYGFFRIFVGELIHEDVNSLTNSIISTFEKSS